ncbi:hypothetical protein GCM10010517_75530 [Streptosporangium fragile]|uniref:non-specific serine/threonine protein kinase n=1 Tax=Streptosporangium fragile TaxID=46186 RepID=A0ABN3WCY2_9ACTN
MPYAQPLKTGDPARLGDYEIVGRLGEGGQGAVYVAVRTDTGLEPYAVKLLHASVGDDPEAFLREVELAKQVARFCTAQVIDAGLDGDRPYIVSEYVDGPSLHREVAVGGPREGGALERLAIGTATALAAIHRAGIVHRDFKPQNVLLGPDGPRVIDFGLARALDAAATQSGRGAGTPAYMAPEQVEGVGIDPAADVFSWGATMCFAANAQAPFGQDSIAAVLHRILTADPQLGRLDGPLRALVADCLDKNPRNRPTSRELLLALLGDDGHHAALSPSRSAPSAALNTRALATPVTSRGPGTPGGGEVSGVSGGGVSGAFALFGASGDAEASGRWARRVALAGWAGQTGRGRPTGGEALSGGGGSTAGGGLAGGGGFIGDEDVDGHRTHPGRAATRASVAVSGALLVSAAVLAGVLVPALSGGGGQGPQAQPAVPVVETSAQAETTPQSHRAEPSARPSQTTQARPPRAVGASSAPLSPPDTVPVPSLVGLDRAEAARLIKRAGLAAGDIRAVDSDRPVGQVLRSWPEAGAAAEKGSKVDIEVSAGIRVPTLAGLGRRAAEAVLAQVGLATGEVSVRCSDQPAGQVLASSPGEGKRVTSGTAVALVVSRNGAEVPSVTGRSEADASASLAAAGFGARARARLVTDPGQAGVVLAQSAAPGRCLRPGATVVITVGVEAQTGPEPEPEPTQTSTLPGPTPQEPVPGEHASAEVGD